MSNIASAEPSGDQLGIDSCPDARVNCRGGPPSRGTRKTLRTPALDLGILAGVTRQTLLELAGPCGYTVEEGAFPLAEVLEADEVFTSSSVREILPVAELDGRRFDLGAAGAVLQQALRERAAKV